MSTLALELERPEADHRPLSATNIERFVLAGNARFTVRNVLTGNRFTFRISKADERRNCGSLWFVAVLSGSDNESDYTYLGTLYARDRQHAPEYRAGRTSRITSEAPSAKAFTWFWRNRNALPVFVEVHHKGHCGRCGRALTVPESIESGIGPECARRMS